MSNEIKRIGVLTGGGDCPGLNAVIRAVVRTAILKYNLEVVGIKNGYRGLYAGQYEPLTLENTSGILHVGGTILFNSNKDNLFNYPVEENGKIVYKDVSDVGVETLKKAGCDALIIIGGDGTLTSGRDFSRKGVKVVGVPKTIDNDLASTDLTFGFDSAVNVATEAIDRLHTTAYSHHRVMLLEVMGRYAGFIALHAGVAGGADVILIPEIPYDIHKVAEAINRRRAMGKDFSVITVAEGAVSKDGKMVISHIVEDSPDPIRLGGVANVIAKQLEPLCGLEVRATVLGHIQRGGSPSPFDRILSTQFGSKAVELLMEGKYGTMVTLKGNQLSYDYLENVIGKNKAVDPNGDLVRAARNIGISFGD